MFKLFAKKQDVAVEAVVSEYVVCRSFYGFAFHIRATAQDDGLTLCGVKYLDDRGVITAKDVIAELPQQHSNWFYCAVCANQLTGVSEDEIRSYRESR